MDQTMNDLTQQEDIARFLVLIRQHLKLADKESELAMSADLDGLGLDSQSALGLMLDLEEAFGVVFPNSLLNEEAFATPNSLWEALSSLRRL
jgi:acyl carrier protein